MDPILPSETFVHQSSRNSPARVAINCLVKGEAAVKLVHLPDTIQELLSVGTRKFGYNFSKVLTKEGAEIDDIELIRDGDSLILVADEGFVNSPCYTIEESTTMDMQNGES